MRANELIGPWEVEEDKPKGLPLLKNFSMSQSTTLSFSVSDKPYVRAYQAPLIEYRKAVAKP
jgi:hypothetical protein